jgi:hypothetical protein
VGVFDFSDRYQRVTWSGVTVRIRTVPRVGRMCRSRLTVWLGFGHVEEDPRWPVSRGLERNTIVDVVVVVDCVAPQQCRTATVVIGGSLCGNAPYRMLPVSCPRPKGKGVLTGVSPCQNTLARGSPDWTRTSTGWNSPDWQTALSKPFD